MVCIRFMRRDATETTMTATVTATEMGTATEYAVIHYSKPKVAGR